ncbi:hypothetical protein Sj15T_00530 [Sphingobium sp. TA15]|uniref:Uncharacterized protein n=2 Tax=Sphingobium indicum TaxID=332055 RepID=D4YZC5_SPHIU|nr:hypothetical protein [Sphingobium indicum]EPR16138.1 hypothetical protein M527_22450 [Sphingobium indicum IP26]KER35180.1 hypothetical protein AL00_17645 [Sphingobium indicum F2]BAI95707.1 hypothetical protein SJA_C1-08730 [Sphingobium indicum UT26S]BDD65032.1 hypothetical protein Sj15T_00530 [Sphingobium sp. TA15]
MYERHNIIIFKSNLTGKRRGDVRGFAMMLEVDNRRRATEYILWPKSKKVIPTLQDRFMRGLDQHFSNLANWNSETRQLTAFKIVFGTIVDDERMQRELESLFYCWWATNRGKMQGEFECVHV